MKQILCRAGRYLRTIRHLRGGQIVAQGWNRIRLSLEHPERWNPGPVPSRPTWVSGEPGDLPPPTPAANLSDVKRGQFRFAGETREVGWPPQWNAEGASALWQYNLHYHDWLWDLLEGGEWEQALEGVADWITRYPLERGAVGWDPYPISLRLQNWTLLLFRGDPERLAVSGQADLFWASLWKQALRLEARLERHLLGNHLLENAVTLTLLGVTFAGRDAERWRAKGLTLLRKELAEQMLPDGMHFELTPMYHLRVTWLLAMLDSLDDKEVSELVRTPLERANYALERVRHPDGGIALLNDSGAGIYSDPPGERQAESGPWSLPDAGYYGYRSDDGDYLVCDAGKIGPDYLPGHSHADCLSFELSVRGQRIVTDTGVADYGVKKERCRVRSTAAHNTVEIEGEDQAEMWGAFRVGARGYPKDVRWEPRVDGFRLSAAHSGYKRLGAAVTHSRCFDLCKGKLRIRDEVRGRGSFVAISRLHLAPECEVEEDGRILWGEGSARVQVEGPGTITIGESPAYERFGEAILRAVLSYRVEVRGEATWETTLEW